MEHSPALGKIKYHKLEVQVHFSFLWTSILSKRLTDYMKGEKKCFSCNSYEL